MLKVVIMLLVASFLGCSTVPAGKSAEEKLVIEIFGGEEYDPTRKPNFTFDRISLRTTVFDEFVALCQFDDNKNCKKIGKADIQKYGKMAGYFARFKHMKHGGMYNYLPIILENKDRYWLRVYVTDPIVKVVEIVDGVYNKDE